MLRCYQAIMKIVSQYVFQGILNFTELQCSLAISDQSWCAQILLTAYKTLESVCVM